MVSIELVVTKLAVVILTAYATVSMAAVWILNCYASFLVEEAEETRTRVVSAVVTVPASRVSAREPHGSHRSSVRSLAVCSLDEFLQQLEPTHLVLVAEEAPRNIHNFRIEGAMLTWSCQLGVSYLDTRHIRVLN